MYTRFLISFCLLGLLTLSCSKDDNGIQLGPGDWLQFGQFNCAWAPATKIFKIQDEQLYRLDTASCTLDTIVFTAPALSAEQWKKALRLLDEFPAALKTSAGGVNYDLGNCADCVGYGLWLSQNGVTRYWNFGYLDERALEWQRHYLSEIALTIQALQ